MVGNSDLPNLVVAGVMKGGTSSLFWYLSQHEQVCASDVKETKYFLPMRSGLPLASPRAYASHFRHYQGEKYLMESTPEYFIGGSSLASAIDEMLPSARVILSLRDPVDRFLSHYNHVRRLSYIPQAMSPRQYLGRCEELHAEGLDDLPENRAYWGLSHGLYDRYIDAWIETFGERLLTVFFEQWTRAPQDGIGEVFKWLNIDPQVSEALEYTVENQNVMYGSKLLHQSVVRLGFRYRRFLTRHRRLKLALRGLYYAVNSNGEQVRLDDATAERLRTFYAPSNYCLRSRLVGLGYRDLPCWLMRDA